MGKITGEYKCWCKELFELDEKVTLLEDKIVERSSFLQKVHQRHIV